MGIEEMVKKWDATRSISLAYDICEFLANNMKGDNDAVGAN